MRNPTVSRTVCRHANARQHGYGLRTSISNEKSLFRDIRAVSRQGRMVGQACDFAGAFCAAGAWQKADMASTAVSSRWLVDTFPEVQEGQKPLPRPRERCSCIGHRTSC